MLTNIVIDDTLIADALHATGLRTMREVVELGLKALIRLQRQADIRRYRGKLDWQGSLDTTRTDT